MFFANHISGPVSAIVRMFVCRSFCSIPNKQTSHTCNGLTALYMLTTKAAFTLH